jgi:hypothetical protein
VTETGMRTKLQEQIAKVMPLVEELRLVVQ